MSDEAQKQEDSMEDILASIRETVEEEVEKGDAVSEDTASEISEDPLAADLLSEDIEDDEVEPSTEDNAAAAADMMAEISGTDETTDEAPAVEEPVVEEPAGEVTADDLLSEDIEDEAVQADAPTSDVDDVRADDILDLTDIVDESTDAEPEEGLIDVEKFAQSGEISSAEAGDVKASRESYGEAEDDIEVDLDGIMSELEDEGELPNEEDAASFIAKNNNEEAEDDSADDLLNEDSDDDLLSADAEEEAPVEQTPAEEPTPAPVSQETVNKVSEVAAEEIAKKVFLPTTPSPKGLQVSFPAEVLAEALRPLVTDWINQNLADIVERLVKEEISKLVDK